MKLTHPLIVLDLETTGLWIEKDKVISPEMEEKLKGMIKSVVELHKS